MTVVREGGSDRNRRSTVTGNDANCEKSVRNNEVEKYSKFDCDDGSDY